MTEQGAHSPGLIRRQMRVLGSRRHRRSGGGTSWTEAARQFCRDGRDLRRRLRLVLIGLRVAFLRSRLERLLQACRRAEQRPWVLTPVARLWGNGSRPRCAATGLLLILVAWPAAGGRSPEIRAMAPALSTAPAVRATLVIPAPSSIAPVPQYVPPASAEDFARGNRSMPEIAFTFDGHDGANVAGEILDFLQARGARATLFLGGRFIRVFPDLVRRMVADGHEIGNHLDTHPYLTTYAQNRRHETLPGVTREVVLGELRRAEASFRALTGRSMAPYWRAPYGEHNGEIRAWAADGGYRHIGWTRRAGAAEDLDTRDWVADTSSRIYRSREEIVTRILEFGGGRPGALNGGVILMHLNTHRQADRPHEALPHLLKSLQDQGYRLVTVSELLAHAAQRQAVVASSATPQSSAKVQALIR